MKLTFIKIIMNNLKNEISLVAGLIFFSTITGNYLIVEESETFVKINCRILFYFN